MADGLPKINFADAKETHYEAMPAGRYNATVFEATMREVKNEGGKLAVGTPMVNVQFRIEDDEYANRRVFRSFPIPPADYDKYQQLMDTLFTFYKAVGYTDKEMQKWSSLPDLDELNGRECVVKVTRREYPKGSGEYTNDVSDVYPAGTTAGGAASSTVGGLANL